MCFSAEVSFGASAILVTTGVLTIRKSNKKNQLFFAMIPILFGIQQFMEGWVWVSLQNEGYNIISTVSMFGFLIFAQLIWPVWVPLSAYTLETNKTRKLLITFSLALGIFLALLLGYRFFAYEVSASIEAKHIFYQVGHFKSTNWWSGIFYLLPALFPFIFSSHKKINILGYLMLLLFVISKVFYIRYMISTWCLFAGVLSIYIWFIVKDMNRVKELD
jgi:hypothetical protein